MFSRACKFGVFFGFLLLWSCSSGSSALGPSTSPVETVEADPDTEPSHSSPVETSEAIDEEEQESSILEIIGELLIDGEMVSQPRVRTLSERPVTISSDYEGERILTVELVPQIIEPGLIHLSGSVHSRDRLVHQIDNRLVDGETLSLAIVIDGRTYELNLAASLQAST